MISNDAQYSGDISPKDTFHALLEARETNNKAFLIDVRTRAEWLFVGTPALPENQLICCEWQIFPNMIVNSDFAATIETEIATKCHLNSNDSLSLYFLCRSGARSQSAAIAMTKAGFTHCYNISDGFEGPLDSEYHRGRIRGWKADNLPWKQS